ncbi:MAG TPA: NAD(P)/FAD-dependent oxidoreductase [Solirubrobacterales bacterium]|nr:NAD(P)/FAD-dependent oxidoreductase [Solirubrobacterales bacterium]
MPQVHIVGSGPNGLTCAAVLARAGVEVTVYEAGSTIGGGTRSVDLTGQGLIHDVCSAVHPMAVASPAFLELDLEAHGLEWCFPEVDLAHPLDGGRAGVMVRDIEETAAGLGEDGKAWTRLFGPSARAFPRLGGDINQPIIHFPEHPISLARFGIPSLAPASTLARGFSTDEGRALFGGVAAHSFSPMTRMMSSAVGMALICAGHAWGWPVARGGSQSIADALASVITSSGGRIETGRLIRSIDDLPAGEPVVFDTSPAGVVGLAGHRMPEGVRKAFQRYEYGPAAFKLDLAVEDGIPWESEAARKAGTVHVIGSFEELVISEHETHAGRMPERPFILVGQQYLADPSRSNGNLHPVWAYAHVPNGFTGDATEAMVSQIERFAPGFRDRIRGETAMYPEDFAQYNANYVGGDIVAGANTPRQMVFRPRVTLNPYKVTEGIWICSAATPPGGGVHGMGGANAARSILSTLGS